MHIGPSLRSGGDPLWSKVSLLLQGGTIADKSAAATATDLVGASKITLSSTEWLDAGLPTIKISSAQFDGIYPAVRMPVPALSTQNWTFEMAVRVTATGFFMWADDAGGRSSGLRLSMQSTFGFPNALELDLNNGAIGGRTSNLNASFPMTLYLCAERVGRFIYLSNNGVVLATIDLGSTSYAINAPIVTPRFGQAPSVGSAFDAHIGRVRLTVGASRYGGANFTPPTGIYQIG